MSQDGVIWSIAAGLSLALHLTVLLDTGSTAGQEKKIAQPQTTRVSFRTAPAVKSQPQEAPPEPEKKVVEPPPKPRAKPKAVKKKVPKRIEKVRKVTPQPPTPQQEVMEQMAAAPGTIDDPALLERAKHEYLRRLMAHIESHKRYPRVARRRGIEGEVEVSFRLLQGGNIDNVTVAQGHKVLRKAVEEALASAQPMPAPPEKLRVPMSLSFKVKFSLHNG